MISYNSNYGIIMNIEYRKRRKEKGERKKDNGSTWFDKFTTRAHHKRTKRKGKWENVK